MTLVLDSWEILDTRYTEHEPVRIFLLFSGGHDSLTATHVSAGWCRERGFDFQVVHINTGIGIEQTRQFVRETSHDQGWDLIELEGDRLEQTYEYSVLKYGFPGPSSHSFMYRRLKERKVERLVREAKVGHPRTSRVFLVTGMRRQESRRSMLHADFHRRRGSQVWLSPLEHWSKSDCSTYLEEEGLPRNEVVDLLHFSGECLCGAFSPSDQMKELETWFPEDAERIHELERRVEAVGQANCVWGYSARFTSEVNRSQGHLFSPLCIDCESRIEVTDE